MYEWIDAVLLHHHDLHGNHLRELSSCGMCRDSLALKAKQEAKAAKAAAEAGGGAPVSGKK